MNVHFPCCDIPLVMETVFQSGDVSVLLPGNVETGIHKGQAVTEGEPLFNPEPRFRLQYPTVYAPVCGVISEVKKYNDIVEGKTTCVTLHPNGYATKQRLFNPVNKVDALKSDTLKRMFQAGGFSIPDTVCILLVYLVDEDVESSVNRWLFEYEFEKLHTGLQAIKKAFPHVAPVMVAQNNADDDKLGRCYRLGKVITVKCSYPDVHRSIIIRNDEALKTADTIAVISAEKVFNLSEMLSTSIAPCRTLISFRNGKKGIPRLFNVPLGITIRDFLSALKCTLKSGMQIVIGGTFTGVACTDVTHPIGFNDTAVLLLYPEEIPKKGNNPCIRCGRCRAVCPSNLHVDLISKAVECDRYEHAHNLGVGSCIECGLCTAVCANKRPLLHFMKTAKAVIGKWNQ